MLKFGEDKDVFLRKEENGMFRGLHAATSGMMAYNRQQQVLTNNLSNAVTPGYKSDTTAFRSFPQQLIEKLGNGNMNGLSGSLAGTMSVGTYAQEAIPNFSQGILKETKNSTDFALQSSFLPLDPATNQKGALVFAVETANGDIRYSQNGQLQVNQEGFLVTAKDEQVLDSNQQPIRLTSMDFQVDAQGGLTVAGEAGPTMWIGYTSDPKSLVKEGSGLLRYEGPEENSPQLATTTPLVTDGDTLIMQGFLEQSNVDLSKVMTDMLRTYRGFESNQKVLQAYDQSMQKAVTEIGRV